MNRDFIGALLQLNAEKGVPQEILIRTLEQAIESAYRRNADAPENVVVSVEGLEDGTKLFASDVELPKGAALLSDPEMLVINVHVPQKVDLGEEPEEGVEGEEAAEGEAPAEEAVAEESAE